MGQILAEIAVQCSLSDLNAVRLEVGINHGSEAKEKGHESRSSSQPIRGQRDAIIVAGRGEFAKGMLTFSASVPSYESDDRRPNGRVKPRPRIQQD
ncbi:MAG: hypothetical protein NTW19_06175 [Planctomycetota bacterium]|nr:hypothetical protein [Planctomycetota bacterium]